MKEIKHFIKKIFKNEIFKNPISLAIIIGSIFIALGIIAFALINNNSNKSDKDQTLYNLVNSDKIFSGKDFKDNEYILGNNKNKITLVVYSDFECPYCKIFQEDTIQKLQDEYKLKDDFSEGKIAIVYRHFAQSYHTNVPTEINASLCARELYGQNTYINFINRIYSITPSNNGLDLKTLPDIASFAVNEAKDNNQTIKKDFDKDEFSTCVSNNTYMQELSDDQNDSIESGLDGTPYSVLLYRDNDQNMILAKVSGAKDKSYYEKIIDKLLKIEK